MPKLEDAGNCLKLLKMAPNWEYRDVGGSSSSFFGLKQLTFGRGVIVYRNVFGVGPDGPSCQGVSKNLLPRGLFDFGLFWSLQTWEYWNIV